MKGRRLVNRCPFSWLAIARIVTWIFRRQVVTPASLSARYQRPKESLLHSTLWIKNKIDLFCAKIRFFSIFNHSFIPFRHSCGDTGLSAGRCFPVWRGNRAKRWTLSSGLAGIPGSVLYVVFWSGGDTGLSAGRCLLVWRGYRAQCCTLFSGLSGIPGSALCVVFWSGGDTGLIVGHCLLVWRVYRAQCWTLSSGLAGIPGSVLYVVFWSGGDT